MRTLELLAPAKNLACGIAAIDHGADAVYIGARHFGARVAAGNSVADIGELCRHAHRFGAKVYATVNTLLKDDEVDDAFRLMDELRDVGVDAFLIQDYRLLRQGFDIHASTQTDNRTPEKLAWLSERGIKRVVLARELSLDEIREIHHRVPDVELEVFVHGALCVSYSGLCYASEHCFGRSANRGACAQFCRMKFDLLDADGREFISQRHLLSLKDLCRIDDIEDLAEAGAASFKIEGRLKDIDYVKNVVSAYNQKLNEIVLKYPYKYRRSSFGEVDCRFKPELEKTFNRGFTPYFLHGRQPGMASFATPKSLGERVGRVKEVKAASLTVAGTASFANGDGLCFFNASGELEGFRVNRVEGNRLYPYKMPKTLSAGTAVYRNEDVTFSQLLKRQTAARRIPLRLVLGVTARGFRLSAESQNSKVDIEFDSAHEVAVTPQRENMIRQLTKLGGTVYSCKEVLFEDGSDKYFIPSSLLSSARRSLIEELMERETAGMNTDPDLNPHDSEKQTGCADTQPLLATPSRDLLMQCRYCLRYELGHCTKHGGRAPQWREPLTLRLGDGRKFRLQFDCKHCQMNVYAK